MKRVLVGLVVVLGIFLAIQSCDKKTPPKPNLDDPGYYFPVNFEYKWTYVLLNAQCQVSQDSFSVRVVDRNTRPEGSGWDLVSATGGTTFVYHKGDTIFTLDVKGSPEPFRELVGPIKAGTFWKDVLRGWEYNITGFEDVTSGAGGVVYRGCARVRRSSPGYSQKTDFWWAPQIGKVKRTETDLDGRCVSGEELRRLDKSPNFP